MKGLALLLGFKKGRGVCGLALGEHHGVYVLDAEMDDDLVFKSGLEKLASRLQP